MVWVTHGKAYAMESESETTNSMVWKLVNFGSKHTNSLNKRRIEGLDVTLQPSSTKYLQYSTKLWSLFRTKKLLCFHEMKSIFHGMINLLHGIIPWNQFCGTVGFHGLLTHYKNIFYGIRFSLEISCISWNRTIPWTSCNRFKQFNNVPYCLT